MNSTAALKPDTRNTLAMQQAALQGQIAKLERELAEAAASRNRAIAAATVDASKANLAAKDQATGIVVRIEAELKAVREALAQVDTDFAKAVAANHAKIAADRLRAAERAVRDAVKLAKAVDEAAAQFTENFVALKQAIVNASAATPPELRNDVFGHDMLGEQALKSTATWLLAKTGIVARPLFEPTDYRQTLAALVERFCQPVTDAAKASAAPGKSTGEWED